MTTPRPFIHHPFTTGVLALGLGLLSATVAGLLLDALFPGFFGSHFEGSSGYMMMLVFVPIATGFLAPLYWFLLRRVAGPARFLLALLLAMTLGIVFGVLRWPVRIALAWFTFQAFREHHRQRRPWREAFLLPPPDRDDAGPGRPA